MFHVYLIPSFPHYLLHHDYLLRSSFTTASISFSFNHTVVFTFATSKELLLEGAILTVGEEEEGVEEGREEIGGEV